MSLILQSAGSGLGVSIIGAFFGPVSTVSIAPFRKKDPRMTPEKALLNTLHYKLVFRQRVHALSEVLAKLLPMDAKVLDVGTGEGSIAKLIMERRRDVAIQGVDVLLRPENRTPVTLFDGQHLPFSDGSFDCVMLVDVLHHTENPRMGIVEASRVSRRHIVIKDHLLDGWLAGPVLRCMDWVGNRGHDVALPYKYLLRREWEQIFSEAGLSSELWIEKLGLYPAPAAWLFERGLHFVTRLVKR